MSLFDRREFVSLLSASVAGVATSPLAPLQRTDNQLSMGLTKQTTPCWLDVCAPFVVEDDKRGIHTEIVLTSDTFVGRRGYEGDAHGTNYEIYLYDSSGKAIGADGVARRLMVPAMHTTVISAQDLLATRKSFWGGMKIRLQPRGPEPTHASDLFSSAFVRWQTESSFDNVHANPDPLQWQRLERFYYSMPFPALADYICTLALFNPYSGPSVGEIGLFDQDGNKAITKRYELKSYSSLLLCLNTGSFIDDPTAIFNETDPRKVEETKALAQGGLLAVTNDSQTMKSFAYLMIKQPNRARFSVEHPIHQNLFTPGPETLPFDATGNFKAKNVLYSPPVFNAKKVGAISLESRCWLGTGLPIEQSQWLYPFVTDAQGTIQWDAKKDANLSGLMLPSQYRQGVIRLRAGQSCELDFTRLQLQKNFSGGVSLAVNPDSTHTLMKVEVRVPEWGAHAFTHFRPGLRAARTYQKPKQRGGIATDYIASGARLERNGSELIFDELIAVINIDDRGIEGQPVLELFNSSGLLTRIALGRVPGFSCQHYLFSNLMPSSKKYGSLTLRLVDEEAALLMSILHIDHARRDIALDHGSDRFSTLLDYDCSRTG